MKKININAPINQTGYGIASLNIIRELDKLLDITYIPISNPTLENQNDYNLVQKLAQKLESSFDPKSPLLKIWHQFDLLSRVGNGGPYLAFPFFELDTFNSIEKISLSVPDIVFATSQWSADILSREAKVNKVVKIPLGVDLEVFNPSVCGTESKSKYVFLNIGKWEIRKGHDILLDLFKKAFPNEQDVELWILAPENTNSYSNQTELAQWKNMYLTDHRVKIFTGFQNHKEVAQLIHNSDCGIYPSRAEGWNLELLETMAMNKPVIATNYSAHTEFCTEHNAFLVQTNEVEKAFDGKAFKGQGNWAKFDKQAIEQTIEYMRHVYFNKISNNKNGRLTAERYSWQNTANDIVGCIKNL
jgi:glycosyltransferase involved in cell wall biosynthesis